MPITSALALKLKAAAKGRAPDAPLLLQADGTPWGERPSENYREDIREVVAAIGEDPDMVSMYALRHRPSCARCSSTFRFESLRHRTTPASRRLRGTIRSSSLNTADDISRRALLHHEDADNVAMAG